MLLPALERRAPARAPTYPLVELFGPTVQGEGPDAGRRSFFVRLGGCDYRCSWCDSMHAVDPAKVRRAPRRTATGIAEGLAELGAGEGDLIVLSGGNPALHRGQALVDALHDAGHRVSIETQGSVWREWLAELDRLVVSPKPPSSGEANPRNVARFTRFMHEAWAVGHGQNVALKIVVFDHNDYVWARALLAELETRPTWIGLSCGTRSVELEPLEATAHRYRKLCETVAADTSPAMRGVVALPQLHVIAWGHALGR